MIPVTHIIEATVTYDGTDTNPAYNLLDLYTGIPLDDYTSRSIYHFRKAKHHEDISIPLEVLQENIMWTEPPGGFDIGVWGVYPDAVGSQFLHGSKGSHSEELAVFESFQNELTRKFPNLSNYRMSFSFVDGCLLDAQARAKLMAHADSCRTDETDLKVDLTVAELSQLVGTAAAASVTKIFASKGGFINDIKIRRVVPSPQGQSINFHLDHAVCTMQIPLNSEDAYQGGRLVYATRQGLVWPSRKAGSATIHDNSVPHGVTAHTSGLRYSLFLLKQDLN